MNQPSSRATEAAREALASNPDLWYHTIELAPGVVTSGYIDLRKAAARVLPDDLGGLRVLDVGTFDGFWAFEAERRGAEVVAIDLGHIDQVEFPPLSRSMLEARTRDTGFELGRGFRIAAEALGSTVERVTCNVYELEPGRIGGPVDLAFNGATLTHLRDPVRALERVRETLVPGGELISTSRSRSGSACARRASRPPRSAPTSPSTRGGSPTSPPCTPGCARRGSTRSAGWRSPARLRRSAATPSTSPTPAGALTLEQRRSGVDGRDGGETAGPRRQRPLLDCGPTTKPGGRHIDQV